MEMAIFLIGATLGYIAAQALARLRRGRAGLFDPHPGARTAGLGSSWLRGLGSENHGVTGGTGTDPSLNNFGPAVDPQPKQPLCWVCGRGRSDGHQHVGA